MRIELKSFQEEAARELLKSIRHAREEARDGIDQAIVLSSPTGSGKTVTITALMEWIYQGYEATVGDPEATFLWLSHSPELNRQSRDKILRQSSVFQESQLILVESPFSQEYFDKGKVYFLNTGKLGKDRLLTTTGDGRDYTIWQTIQNTASSKSEHFYVIIDEAHFGATQTNRDREHATTIMQKFLKGSPEDGLLPIKLVIGMSATPERFTHLLEGLRRTKREYFIKPQDVKASGLLKDKIVVLHPKGNQLADLSMLEMATRRWLRFCDEWKEYCSAQSIEQSIRPVMVIQAENGNDRIPTRTNLDEVVTVVERVTGVLPENAWAHAFEGNEAIEAGNRKIRKIEASSIQDDPQIQIVLFKMSLSTGWDCPRAEVMMSFRNARDHTHIAQLVGRMVRTPLARAIEGQEFLNTVALYLPHFDQNGLKAILDKLNTPDAESGLAIDVEDGTQSIDFVRDAGKAELFVKLEQLPTYRIERISKISNVRRLMKLARQLTVFDELDPSALSEAKKVILETLTNELERLRANSNFVEQVIKNEEIDIVEVWVEYGEWKILESPRTQKIKSTPENIDELFEQCGRNLGDEGLHMEFWRTRQDKENPYRAKLELFWILQDKTAWQTMELACGERFQELFRKHYEAIKQLPSGKQEYYWRLRRVAKNPEPEPLRLPPSISVRKEGANLEKHLFVDDSGMFCAKLNETWETPVINEELSRKEVIGWLRNIPRKPWSLCVPYKLNGEDKGCYPDFLIFRLEGSEIIVDIIEPHRTDLTDAVPKAKGLAEYARKHGDQFGRIEYIIVTRGGEIMRLDLNKEAIRERVLKVESQSHLEQLLGDWG
ncbi:hypothetical protein DWB58_00745 [candidate division KSB1 bacterium]|nr:hypothetical protein [candidate division KSB1 bacterium]